MILVPIAAVPNQTFSISLNNMRYDIAIYVARNIMAIDIERDNETLVLGLRLVPNSLVIPYKYLEEGNFIILTDDEEYPYYTQFGISQQLLYASSAELLSLRAENGE